MKFLDEGESKSAVSPPRKVAAVSAFPAVAAVVDTAAGDGEEKKISKRELTKKINRFYADWLDDLTPPHVSPTKEEISIS